MPMVPPSRVALPCLSLPLLACLLAVGAEACANRGMQAPDEIDDDGGFGDGGSPGTGGRGGQATGGTSAVGAGGMAGSTAGRGGSGGTTGSAGMGGGRASTGGATGTGGVIGTGGSTGTGGVIGTGGVVGTGGVIGTGGSTGTGGVIGTGGSTGTGGSPSTGGVIGTGGSPSTGGSTGTGGSPSTGGSTGTGGKGGTTGTGGSGGHGGSGGAGGAAGAGGNMCPLGGVLDCSSTGALTLTPDGQVADFSTPEWNNSTGQWCDADGLRGSVFAYSGASPSTATASVDTTAQNLKLDLTVGAMGYAGGGLSFESCVNASGFTSLQFTATITAGSLTGCAWQVQLQTQDQRSSGATNPSGGTCNPDAGASCYRYPAVANLAVPTATATTYTEAFTLFNNPSSSAIATPAQVTGIQWQVNSASSGTGTCTVELRLDNIKFE
jgi:hypothetical protein